MGLTYRDLVTGSINLVSVPELYVQINDLVENPTSSTTDIGNVISQDPALTARLLKIANSPFYGFSSKIDTISRAVMVIGTRGLRDLVLAASAVDVFSKIPSDAISMASFWRHSIYCGVIARALADKCHVLHSERLFVTGLLHDIGQLVIFHKLPEMAREALYSSQSKAQPMYQAEREVMGFDHAQVGGEILKTWQLPDSITEAIICHHQPGTADNYHLEASLIHIATYLACVVEGSSAEERPSSIDPVAWQNCNLSEDIIDPLLQETRPQLIAALSMFLPKELKAV